MEILALNFIKKIFSHFLEMLALNFRKSRKNVSFFGNFSIKFSKISKKCFNFLEILALNFYGKKYQYGKNINVSILLGIGIGKSATPNRLTTTRALRGYP